jgi:hypothetical protein
MNTITHQSNGKDGYLYDGMHSKPAPYRNYPGYVRLKHPETGHVIRIRADRVKVTVTA